MIMNICDHATITGAMEQAATSFAPDELAFLALTVKPERMIQERLANQLRLALPGLTVAPEWRRTDIAVLAPDGKPLVLLEAKAMYSADVAWPDRANGFLYPEYMRRDVVKAHQLDASADVYVLALVVHPHGVPESQPDVLKYRGLIRQSLASKGEGELRRMAVATMADALSKLGPVQTGSMAGGSAFGVEVSVDWQLAGPCSAV
jgi:hypothetical protein